MASNADASLPPRELPTMIRTLSTAFTPCIHTLTQSQDSVLALAVTSTHLFAGTQSGCIHVWSLQTLQLVRTLRQHRGHILSLTASADERMLFSAGDEGRVYVWDLGSPSMPCLCHIYAGADCGDIYALAFCNTTDTLYLGCKNTSIQWFNVRDRCETARAQVLAELATRNDRFFDMVSPETRPSPHLESEDGGPIIGVHIIMDDSILPMGHYGFVYALAIGLLPSGQQVLCSGASDGRVKIWRIGDRKPELLQELIASSGSVLALSIFDGLLFTGAQGGAVKVWDLETFQCIRRLGGHTDDVVSLTYVHNVVFSGSADGVIKKWNRNFECIQTMQEHSGGVFALEASASCVFSGSGDNLIKLWELPPVSARKDDQPEQVQDQMIGALAKFVAFPTVSGDLAFREDCRKGAKFLKSLFSELGAEAKLVPGAEGCNPLIMAKFAASQNIDSTRKPLDVLFYGHYDVQPADQVRWSSPPFQLDGRDGYVYGRGVTDNKGPILATLFAVSELYEQRKLRCNVCFVIEGEEESGSIGFREAIQAQKDFIGNVDAICMSNSYWINDETPCLTYGLRGVIHAKIKIRRSTQRDLHSGVDGGAVDEPLNDLIKLLNQLISNDKKVLIPGFNDDVRPINERELEMLSALIEQTCNSDADAENMKQSLMARWRFPTLTIHKIEVSGPASNTVIPKDATATVSMRIVPNQQLDEICRRFETYLKECFVMLDTCNELSISIGHKADWWLAKPDKCLFYKAAEKAIEQQWHQKPLYIREGGSIPAVPFLENAYQACVVHIPMGQSSDNAHLPNERIRLENLTTGRRVMRDFLTNLGQLPRCKPKK